MTDDCEESSDLNESEDQNATSSTSVGTKRKADTSTEFVAVSAVKRRYLKFNTMFALLGIYLFISQL
jgi:hypothetical protein